MNLSQGAANQRANALAAENERLRRLALQAVNLVRQAPFGAYHAWKIDGSTSAARTLDQWSRSLDRLRQEIEGGGEG